MISMWILSKKSQLLQLRLAVYLNNWRQGLGAGLGYQWGDQRCLPIIVKIQFSIMWHWQSRDVIKFQCLWLSDWVRPQKSAKLQAKIPVPQGLGWPLPLKRGYKIGRRKSDKGHKRGPIWPFPLKKKKMEDEIVLPQRKVSFKLTFPEKIQIGKWIDDQEYKTIDQVSEA